jgi:hypothetical protein
MASLDYFQPTPPFTGSGLCKKYESCFVQLNSSRKINVSFAESCTAVLNGSNKQVNYIEFNSTLNRLMRDNLRLVDVTVYKVVQERLVLFKIHIDKQLEHNTFSIESFIKMYNIFYTQTQLFIKLLSDYGKLDRSHYPKWLNNNTPQKLMTAIHVSFYSNIVDEYYVYKKESNVKAYTLYDLLGILIVAENTDIYTIICVFQMYMYFNKICKSKVKTVSSEDKAESTEVVSNKLLDLGTNQQFISGLMELISVNMSKDYNISNVSVIIDVSTNFSNRSMFNFYYDKHLEKRLTSSKIIIATETEKLLLTQHFNTKEDSKEIQCMMYKIDDFNENKEHNFMYSNMKVVFGSDKYKHLKQPIILDKSKIEVTTLRQGAWSDTTATEYDNYQLPTEMEAYVDVLSVYYHRRYPYRNLRFNFNNSVGVISLTIKEKEYQFQVTTSQMILLFQFNDVDELSGYSLAKNMGISLVSLEPILNSMLKSKLLVRTAGSSDNPKLKFYINSEFSHKNSKVSLVNYMKVSNKKTTDKLDSTDTNGKDNIIKSMIIHVLSEKVEFGFTKTFDEVKRKLPKYIKKDFYVGDFDKCITYIIKDGTINEKLDENNVRIFSLNSSKSETGSSTDDSQEE